MKSVIGWILIILILAAGILSFIFPAQAKDITNNVIAFLNTPIMIAGISTTIGGIIIFVVARFVVNNSKFGKKELDNIKNEFKELKDGVDESKKNVESLFVTYADKYGELRDTCNNQVTIMLEQFESLQKETLAALKTIPNKKVQSIVAEYEAKYEEEKQEIIDKTIYTNDYIDNKLNELRQDMEKMLNEAKERINSETEAA